MAVTFALSDLTRDVSASKRRHMGTLTLTGTTSDDGDTLSPGTIALKYIDELLLEAAIDDTSNPENAFYPRWNKTSGKIVLYTAHGTPGGTVPLLQADAGVTVTNYKVRFEAIGR